MSTVVVTGTQWGDEGKGKIVDYLAEKADIVVRYQGGSNAGHTVTVDGKEFKQRLMPSGMLYDNKICVIANGVAFDPEVILQEMNLSLSTICYHLSLFYQLYRDLNIGSLLITLKITPNN